VGTEGGFPFFVSGSLPIPPEWRGPVRWTLRQSNDTGTNSAISQAVSFDVTTIRCPSLAANVPCLPANGGTLTLTGQINRLSSRIDVGFDVDLSTANTPIAK